MDITKIAIAVALGLIVSATAILTYYNYKTVKFHEEVINSILDELEKIIVRQQARDLACKINDLFTGKDKPEDLKKAIKSVTKKPAKKTAKKTTTKKTTKKEK